MVLLEDRVLSLEQKLDAVITRLNNQHTIQPDIHHVTFSHLDTNKDQKLKSDELALKLNEDGDLFTEAQIKMIVDFYSSKEDVTEGDKYLKLYEYISLRNSLDKYYREFAVFDSQAIGKILASHSDDHEEAMKSPANQLLASVIGPEVEYRYILKSVILSLTWYEDSDDKNILREYAVARAAEYDNETKKWKHYLTVDTYLLFRMIFHREQDTENWNAKNLDDKEHLIYEIHAVNNKYSLGWLNYIAKPGE